MVLELKKSILFSPHLFRYRQFLILSKMSSMHLLNCSIGDQEFQASLQELTFSFQGWESYVQLRFRKALFALLWRDFICVYEVHWAQILLQHHLNYYQNLPMCMFILYLMILTLLKQRLFRVFETLLSWEALALLTLSIVFHMLAYSWNCCRSTMIWWAFPWLLECCWV